MKNLLLLSLIFSTVSFGSDFSEISTGDAFISVSSSTISSGGTRRPGRGTGRGRGTGNPYQTKQTCGSSPTCNDLIATCIGSKRWQCLEYNGIGQCINGTCSDL